MRRILIASVATGMLALAACSDNDTTVDTAVVDTGATVVAVPEPAPTVTNSSTTVVHDQASPSETTVSTAVDTNGTATVSTTTK